VSARILCHPLPRCARLQFRNFDVADEAIEDTSAEAAHHHGIAKAIDELITSPIGGDDI
jgi:hypothetical protein